jgi:hypothetical protein
LTAAIAFERALASASAAARWPTWSTVIVTAPTRTMNAAAIGSQRATGSRLHRSDRPIEALRDLRL